MARKLSRKNLNLLDLIPERAFGHAVGEDGLVTVDMPRFHIAWMQRYLVPASKSPFIKVKLDRFGSRAWLCCDGARTVGSIAEILENEFGEEVRPVHERIGKFIHLLKNRGFIRLRTADGTSVR